MNKDKTSFAEFVGSTREDVQKFWDDFITDQANYLAQTFDSQILTDSTSNLCEKRKSKSRSKSNWRNNIEILV